MGFLLGSCKTGLEFNLEAHWTWYVRTHILSRAPSKGVRAPLNAVSLTKDRFRVQLLILACSWEY